MQLRRAKDDRISELIEWHSTRALETAQRATLLRLMRPRANEDRRVLQRAR